MLSPEGRESKEEEELETLIKDLVRALDKSFQAKKEPLQEWKTLDIPAEQQQLEINHTEEGYELIEDIEEEEEEFEQVDFKKFVVGETEERMSEEDVEKIKRIMSDITFPDSSKPGNKKEGSFF